MPRTRGAAHAAAPAQVPAGGSRHQQALGVGLQSLKGDCLLGGDGVILRLHSRHNTAGAAWQSERTSAVAGASRLGWFLLGPDAKNVAKRRSMAAAEVRSSG
jgi:hypothetical protein